MTKNNADKEIKSIEDLKYILGSETESDKETTTEDVRMKALQDTIEQFFRIDDVKGFTRTDIERYIIIPFSILYSFSLNPLPLYNDYLKQKGEKNKIIEIEEIEKFLSDIYIKILVSKSRLGRGEGIKSISSLYSNLGKYEDNEDKKINRIVEDLSK